jgi:hypothetical protein
MAFLAALPALASAAASIFSTFKSGSGQKKISNFDKNQKRFFNQYAQNALQNQGGQQQAMGLLQSMLDPNSEFFKNYENQAMNQFNEQTLPNIAERFAGGGALSSSGFGQALGGAASGLQSDLSAQKSNMIMQALQQLLGQYNTQAQTVLGAQPFDLQDQGAGFSGGFAQGMGNLPWQDIMKMFSGGGSGGNQFPLTQGYDTMFRQQGVF